MTDPDYISTTQTAELLGLSRQRVIQLLQSGELTGILLAPRNWTVSRASVEALQAAREAASAGKPEKGKDTFHSAGTIEIEAGSPAVTGTNTNWGDHLSHLSAAAGEKPKKTQ